MAIWHVKIGRFPVCKLPPALDVAGTCSHLNRESARRAARKLRATGRKPRVVRGACPTGRERRESHHDDRA